MFDKHPEYIKPLVTASAHSAFFSQADGDSLEPGSLGSRDTTAQGHRGRTDALFTDTVQTRVSRDGSSVLPVLV